MMQHHDFADDVEGAILELQVVTVSLDQVGDGDILLMPDLPKLLDRFNPANSKVGADLSEERRRPARPGPYVPDGLGPEVPQHSMEERPRYHMFGIIVELVVLARDPRGRLALGYYLPGSITLSNGVD